MYIRILPYLFIYLHMNFLEMKILSEITMHSKNVALHMSRDIFHIYISLAMILAKKVISIQLLSSVELHSQLERSFALINHNLSVKLAYEMPLNIIIKIFCSLTESVNSDF